MELAARCYNQILYLGKMIGSNNEQAEAAFNSALDYHNQLAAALQVLLNPNIIQIKERRATAEEIVDLEQLMKEIGEDDSTTEEAYDPDLAFANTPESLLAYLNGEDVDSDEEDAGDVLDDDGAQRAVIKEAIKRLNGISQAPQETDNLTYEQLEQENNITFAVKVLKTIDRRITQWQLYRGDDGVWRKGE